MYNEYSEIFFLGNALIAALATIGVSGYGVDRVLMLLAERYSGASRSPVSQTSSGGSNPDGGKEPWWLRYIKYGAVALCSMFLAIMICKYGCSSCGGSKASAAADVANQTPKKK